MLSGNSLRKTAHIHCAFVHQAAKLVAALLGVAGVTAGVADSNGSLPPVYDSSPAGRLPRTGISSGTLRSVIEYGLPLPFTFWVGIPSRYVTKSSTRFGWGNGGNVTSAGWQVTLCDPIWHVSSREDSYKLLYSGYLYLEKWQQQFNSTVIHSEQLGHL